jgi:hypothetical protein
MRVVIRHHEQIARGNLEGVATGFQAGCTTPGKQPVKKDGVFADAIVVRLGGNTPRCGEPGIQKHRARQAQYMQNIGESIHPSIMCKSGGSRKGAGGSVISSLALCADTAFPRCCGEKFEPIVVISTNEIVLAS